MPESNAAVGVVFGELGSVVSFLVLSFRSKSKGLSVGVGPRRRV